MFTRSCWKYIYFLNIKLETYEVQCFVLLQVSRSINIPKRTIVSSSYYNEGVNSDLNTSGTVARCAIVVEDYAKT